MRKADIYAILILCLFFFAAPSLALKLMVVSESVERLIWKSVSKEVSEKYGGAKPDARMAQMNKVFEKIVKQSKKDRDKVNFKLSVLDMNEPNAISCGEALFISRELLGMINKEDELAFILGHEVAHTVRAHMRKKVNEIVLETGGMALLKKTSKNKLIEKGTSTILNVINLGWSREYEREADKVGLRYVVDAGYNPMGAVSMMEKLGGKEAAYHEKLFRSHPPSPDRVKALKDEITRNGWDTTKPFVALPWNQNGEEEGHDENY